MECYFCKLASVCKHRLIDEDCWELSDEICSAFIPEAECLNLPLEQQYNLGIISAENYCEACFDLEGETDYSQMNLDEEF